MNIRPDNGRTLIAPDLQVFTHYRGAALSLLERFLREAKGAYDRGGWPILREYLAKYHSNVTTDRLTGLFTRDAFFELLEKIVLPRMRRVHLKPGMTYGSLVLLDLDRFKKINDAYGHAGGDVVLRVFGELVGRQFRDYDVRGRVGGDEFIVIADGLPPVLVEERMRKLKEDYASYPWTLERIDNGKGGIAMSFSYKVIEIVDPNHVVDLIREADLAVFRSKRAREEAKR